MVGLVVYALRVFWLVGLSFFWFWPFLAFLVVCLRRPCAGQHLLSLPPQRK